jgi:hypothetical protein
VIGGIAAVLYGVPRATFNLDIRIESFPENARRLLDALLDAGMGTASLTNADDILANQIAIHPRDGARRGAGTQFYAKLL